MRIYSDLISNINARVNARTMAADIPAPLRSSIGGSLIYYYALLALTRGSETTPGDAHKAWLLWLASQGGEPQNLDTISEITDLDRRSAEGIRDAAGYEASP